MAYSDKLDGVVNNVLKIRMTSDEVKNDNLKIDVRNIAFWILKKF